MFSLHNCYSLVHPQTDRLCARAVRLLARYYHDQLALLTLPVTRNEYDLIEVSSQDDASLV